MPRSESMKHKPNPLGLGALTIVFLMFVLQFLDEVENLASEKK